MNGQPDLAPEPGVKYAHVSPGDLGACYELFVAADLIQKGFDVFRNLSPNGPTDLVILKQERLLCVQVKNHGKKK